MTIETFCYWTVIVSGILFLLGVSVFAVAIGWKAICQEIERRNISWVRRSTAVRAAYELAELFAKECPRTASNLRYHKKLERELHILKTGQRPETEWQL